MTFRPIPYYIALWSSSYYGPMSLWKDFSGVGISLKELGVSCWNIWNFAQGLKFKVHIYPKMTVFRMTLQQFQHFWLCLLSIRRNLSSCVSWKWRGFMRRTCRPKFVNYGSYSLAWEVNGRAWVVTLWPWTVSASRSWGLTPFWDRTAFTFLTFWWPPKTVHSTVAWIQWSESLLFRSAFVIRKTFHSSMCWVSNIVFHLLRLFQNNINLYFYLAQYS